MPHTLAMQVRAAHSVSEPGHVVGETHPTQAPAPLHTTPPCVHALPLAVGGLEGVPSVQTSSVHWMPSTGRPVSSAFAVTLPAPSHTFCEQSPAVCVETTVPAVWNAMPHTFPTQVRAPHSVSEPGQV